MNSVMATENAPITAIKKQEATNSNKNSALGSLQVLITTLQQAATAMAAPSLFAGRQVSSTTTNSTWSPLADTGTASGNYQIAVSQLAIAASLNGTAGLGLTMNASDTVSNLTVATLPIATPVSAGTFTVNGHQVTIASTDSLDQVFAAIATATGNTVTATYDHLADKVTLASTGGEIVLGAANDSSNFLAAFKLANNGGTSITSSSTLGVINPSATIANARLKAPITAVDGSGNGSFAINGVNISYNVNTDSLASIMTSINQSTAGVTASYDAANDRMSLTNNVTGDLGVSISETAGGLLGAMGLSSGTTLTHGTNAQFTVNGGPVRTSTSNSLSSSDLGVTGLSVAIASQDTQTLVVSGNTGAMNTAINNFISSYNDVQSFLDSATSISSSGGTVSAAVLADNRDVQAWGATLRSTVFGAIPGMTGTIKRLTDLGIDFTPGTSQLAITDVTKLSSALTNKASEVAALFQTNTTGLAYQLSTYTAKLLTQNTQAQTTLTQNNKSLDTQIADIQRRLDQQRALMTASFIAMETANSKMQSQMAALNSAFNSSSSSSSSNTSVSTPKS